MLLLLLLIGGGSSAWGETKTYQHVFNVKPSTGDEVALTGMLWNIVAENLGSYNSQNYAGVQIGAKSKDGFITLTSSADWNYNNATKITAVRLWLNLGGTSVTPSVTIGGKAAVSDGTNVIKNSTIKQDWTKATKVTFTPAEDGNTGVVVINVSTVKAGYICAMEIDCEDGAPAANLTKIEVSGTPTKITYFDGEPFDPTGLVVTGTYDDGTTSPITNGVTWECDPKTLAPETTSVDVMASVGNITSDIYTVKGITVKEKATLIAIEAKGTPAEFWKGDKFNHDGITITARWNDESETDVTEQCQFAEPDMNTAGKKTVTVTYENKTCTYDIEVKTIENTKETAYTVSEAIALIDAGKGLASQVYVKGIVSKIVTPFNIKYGNVSFDVSVDGSTEGQQFRFYRTQKDAENKYEEDPNIEVGATVIGCGTLLLYKDNKAQEDIYEFAAGNYLVDYKAPVEKVLKSIAISGEATKTTYFEGETFDPTGLVVTATYEDESTEVVTSRVKWTFNPETLILGTTEVNVTATYGEKTASKTVAVTVAEVQKYNVTWNVNGNDYTEGNPTTEVVEGEKVEVLPAAPASIVGLVFMGWTNEAVTSQEAAPAVLFTSAADAPAVTADVTYYAVFAAQAGAGWTRVTALSDITEGSYVIKNAGFILPNFKTDKSPQKVTAPSITDNVITGEVDESMVWQFVSTGVSNQFYIKNAAGNYLYVIKDESQGLRVVETPDKWTFEENGVGYFAMMDENSSRYCATYEAGKDWRSYVEKDFRNYANGGKLELYRNDISYSNYTTTVETNSLILRAFDGKNHFATFSSDKAVKFVDATVYAVGVNDDRLILTEVESKQVPANTGVLLKSAGTEATYSVIGSAPAIENNLLCASVEEGQTTAADGTTEGYSFFKLSYNQAGENEKLGFYWAKENGAPFVSKAGLAYLAVKTADVAAVKGFSLFDMETGISKVSGSAAGNGVIYDLQGRRVERAVRGLYIVNGRKVMVK